MIASLARSIGRLLEGEACGPSDCSTPSAPAPEALTDFPETETSRDLRARVESVGRWFHSIDLGHGVVTPGLRTPAIHREKLQLPNLRGNFDACLRAVRPASGTLPARCPSSCVMAWLSDAT